MRKSKAQLRQESNQDALVAELRSDFKKIPDPRAPNVIHHLDDVLINPSCG